MALTNNQVNDYVTQAAGRPATDYENNTFAKAPVQQLANLKSYYGSLNPTNSVVDYLKSVGQDSSMNNRSALEKQYGITSQDQTQRNIDLLKALQNPTPQTQTNLGGNITPNNNPPSSSNQQIGMRNNNPLNLKFAGQNGATQGESGFAKFSDPQAGFQAGVNQIKLATQGGSRVYSPSMSIQQFFDKYAPSSDNNNPQSYANTIARSLGVNTNATMSSLRGREAEMALAMAKIETPQYSSSSTNNVSGGANIGSGDASGGQGMSGSIAGATGAQSDTSNNQTDNKDTPLPSAALKNTYVQAQKSVLDVTGRINDINKSIDASLKNKRDEIARNGGIVDESQLRSLVLAEQAPLLAERKDLLNQRTQLVGEQNIASQNYQGALKQEQLNISNKFKEEQLGLNAQKIDIQQSQFAQKLEQAGYKKVADYQDGTKVGEHYINLSGKNVSIDPSTGQEVTIGSGSTIGSKGSITTGSSKDITKGNISYSDFSKVADAPTAENMNTEYPGTGGKTYGAIYQDAIAYAETGKYQKVGMGSKPSIVAYDNAVKSKAANIAQSLGMTETSLRAAYTANKSALSKLITQKATISAFENKAKAQIDMILNGYVDPHTGKKVPSLNSSVSRSDYPAVNYLFVKGKLLAGDTNTQLLSNSLITFSTEYAKIMSGSTGSSAASSDSARKEASSLINTALSQGTLEATLGLLQKEMDTTIQGYDDQIKQTMGSFVGGSQGGSQTGQPQAVSKGSMSNNDFVEKALSSQNYKYNDLMKDMNSHTPAGTQPALDNNTGLPVYATLEEIKSGAYTPL